MLAAVKLCENQTCASCSKALTELVLVAVKLCENRTCACCSKALGAPEVVLAADRKGKKL